MDPQQSSSYSRGWLHVDRRHSSWSVLVQDEEVAAFAGIDVA